MQQLSAHLADSGLPNRVAGEGNPTLTGCNTIDAAGAGEITFLANPKYRDRVAQCRAAAIILREESSHDARIPQIICEDPYRALTMAVVRIHGYRQHPRWGRGDGAVIAPSAQLGDGANIAPGVVVGDDAILGHNVTLYPGVFVGPGAVLGDDVVLYPNVTVYDRCSLGDRVTVHAGSVIGEDGLGFAPVGDKWIKIPQAGVVIIEDDVEIGANCTIDRATLGATRIGDGTKFSNLIAIGHGCQIGPDCMFVAQVGMAGSVSVGRHVTIAGQAGIAGHLEIGDDVQISAQAGVSNSVKAGMTVLGAPATPVKEARRRYAAWQKLPEMKDRLRTLEREVANLKAALMKSCDEGACSVTEDQDES